MGTLGADTGAGGATLAGRGRGWSGGLFCIVAGGSADEASATVVSEEDSAPDFIGADSFIVSGSVPS